MVTPARADIVLHVCACHVKYIENQKYKDMRGKKKKKKKRREKARQGKARQGKARQLEGS